MRFCAANRAKPAAISCFSQSSPAHCVSACTPCRSLVLPYLQVMTQEEIDAYNRAKVELQNRPNDWEEIYRDFYRRHSFFPDNTISRHNQDGNTSYVDSNGQRQDFDESQTVLYRPMPARISHYRDRKFSGPVFENGFFEQRVENP